MTSIFSDKATIIIRAMLSQPDKKWVIRDFEKEFGVSSGRASRVLATLRKKGFVGGVTSGRRAHSKIIDREGLIKEWVKFYDIDLNRFYLFYSPEINILEKVKKYFKKRNSSDKYALTLHTGANLITNYVNIQSIYCYLDSENFDELLLNIRQGLNLKELKHGGNVLLIKPYYKKSVFFNRQNIKGYPVVSNLQLYLDLYNFAQRGREHAEYLLKVLKERGESIGRQKPFRKTTS